MAIDTHKTICNSLTTTTCRNVDRRDSFLGRPHAKAHGEPISAQTPSPIREWGERRIMRRPGRRALGLMASGATCVQKLDGSRDSAIHTKYRILLRSSSMREPRYPLPRVVLDFTLQHCFRTNTVSGLAKAGCLVAFSLTLFVPGFGDIRKLCVRSNQN